MPGVGSGVKTPPLPAKGWISALCTTLAHAGVGWSGGLDGGGPLEAEVLKSPDAGTGGTLANRPARNHGHSPLPRRGALAGMGNLGVPQ